MQNLVEVDSHIFYKHFTPVTGKGGVYMTPPPPARNYKSASEVKKTFWIIRVCVTVMERPLFLQGELKVKTLFYAGRGGVGGGS